MDTLKEPFLAQVHKCIRIIACTKMVI